MGKWTGVVTNGGSALLSNWIAGTTLNFTGATAGTGTVAAAALMAQTALVNQKQTASVTGYEKVSKGVKIRIQITAPQAGYTLNQFGVWAKLGSGTSTLLALFQNEEGVPIPSYADSPDFVYTFYGIVSMDNTGTFTVTIDTSAAVSIATMTTAIAAAMTAKQDNIMVSGLLKGDGTGNIVPATAGSDYGFPLATGAGAPGDTTVGVAGQHYYDSLTDKEYVCTGQSEDGQYLWKLAGVGDASELTYDGGKMDSALDVMKHNICDNQILSELLMNYTRQNAWEIERGTVTLTNSAKYPFNSSQASIALAASKENGDYTVLAEVLSCSGNVGEITVDDKLTNGFKIAYTGSAKYVKLKYTVIGGYLK